jgi:GNAT superfamily N-acetyltransferase
LTNAPLLPDMTRTLSPTSEAEWGYARALIAELQEWDSQHSQALGFGHQEVLEVFYPGETEDIRRNSAPPGGRFLLAMDANFPVGCAAFRRLSSNACELYNVYVRPLYRGHGFGSALLQRLMNDAKVTGYETMCLETASFMHDAHKLYRSFGFEVCEPHRRIPERFASVTMWMQCKLGTES